jgi:hypothetical protein
MSNTLNDPIETFSNNIKNKINYLFSNDIMLVLTFFLFFTILSIGSIFMFEVGISNVRTQFVNNVIGIMLSILFIILIFKFMDVNISILGKKFEIGFILYIGIVFGLLLLFSS